MMQPSASSGYIDGKKALAIGWQIDAMTKAFKAHRAIAADLTDRGIARQTQSTVAATTLHMPDRSSAVAAKASPRDSASPAATRT